MTPPIALITANIGGFDSIKQIPKQTVEFDRFYYTDDNAPFPMPNLNPRMRSKFYKTQSHHIEELKKYPIHIWIDSSIQIKANNFVDWLTPDYYDIMMFSHPDRSSIKEETDFILKEIASGNKYLSERYAKEPLQKELEYYQKNGYLDNRGFNASTMIGRKNEKYINDLYDDWWRNILCWSNFDQVAFMPSVAASANVGTFKTDNFINNDLFELVPHVKFA